MYDRKITITDEILEELEKTNDNGFRPVIIGTLRQFLPDYLEDETDEDIIELYERKVAQELERQYHDLLNYNYISRQISSANEKLSDIIIREMKKKTIDEMLQYNPYGDKYLLHLVRASHTFANSMTLFDLDGADIWGDGPKKKLEVISLIREARDHLALSLIGFPEYLFASTGKGLQTDVIISFPSVEKSDSPYYRRLVRRVDSKLYELPADTWYWKNEIKPQDRRVILSRIDHLSLSLWMYERRVEFMNLFVSGEHLTDDNAIMQLIKNPCSARIEEGELSQFETGDYPEDFDEKFSDELNEVVNYLNMIDRHEPLESLKIGELEYIAYSLAGCDDKARAMLKEKTGKDQL